MYNSVGTREQANGAGFFRHMLGLLGAVIFFGMILLLVSGALGGCAGDNSRVHVLAPTMAGEWSFIETDAEIGVRAQELPAAAAALQIPNISPGLAEAKRSHRRAFKGALDKLVDTTPASLAPGP